MIRIILLGEMRAEEHVPRQITGIGSTRSFWKRVTENVMKGAGEDIGAWGGNRTRTALGTEGF